MDEKKRFLKSFEDKLKKRLDKDTLSKLSKDSLSFEDDEDFASSDYEEFRKEKLPSTLNFYENICDLSEKLLKISPDKKSAETIQKDLYTAHLSCTPTGVQSASLVIPMMMSLLGLAMFILNISSTIGIGLILIGALSYFAFQGIPKMLAKRVRAKASDEIIIAVFYIVAFMRFNSNFELAVTFAANYLSEPLSLDIKRMLWELENAKYPSIKNAFDVYLESWRDENLEFLESIYLIESSLYESEDFRRISLLDKALDTILQGNYEKMLHFAQELRNKVSAFNMIGIVLPILGLIILPLAASFGDPRSTWEVVFLIYVILLPLGVAYYAFIIVFNRPSSVNSIKPPKNLKNYVNMQKVEIKIGSTTKYINPKYISFMILGLFLFIGALPFIFHANGFDEVLNEKLGERFGKSPFGTFQSFKQIDPKDEPSYIYGPYGIYPGILSLFIPLAFAFSIGYYLRNRYKNLIHLRDRTKKLEKELPSATFQLGNRINEGISAELAFGAVADTMKGTEAGALFSRIDKNIKFNGMSVEKALFDKDKGAMNEYPSDLAISSMKIFVKSIEKGPEIAAKTLIDLSKYLSEIHMANERMIDLLAESLASMKSQASFLAPIISGVVISIVSLVTLILGTLKDATVELSQDSNTEIPNFLGDSIPTYLFQFSVGLYIVSLIVILVYITTSLENGEDTVLMRYEIGEKLMGGLTKYSLIVGFGIVLFAFLGNSVLGTIVS